MGGLWRDLLETSARWVLLRKGGGGGEGYRGMDARAGWREVVVVVVGQLVMNLTESCLCRRQKPG